MLLKLRQDLMINPRDFEAEKDMVEINMFGKA